MRGQALTTDLIDPPAPELGLMEVASAWLAGYGAMQRRHVLPKKKSHMHRVINEVYLQNLFTDGCNFSRRI